MSQAFPAIHTLSESTPILFRTGASLERIIGNRSDPYQAQTAIYAQEFEERGLHGRRQDRDAFCSASDC